MSSTLGNAFLFSIAPSVEESLSELERICLDLGVFGDRPVADCFVLLALGEQKGSDSRRSLERGVRRLGVGVFRKLKSKDGLSKRSSKLRLVAAGVFSLSATVFSEPRDATRGLRRGLFKRDSPKAFKGPS